MNCTIAQMCLTTSRVSEAMEMANRYSEPKSGRYINGVLGAMVRDKQESKA